MSTAAVRESKKRVSLVACRRKGLRAVLCPRHAGALHAQRQQLSIASSFLLPFSLPLLIEGSGKPSCWKETKIKKKKRSVLLALSVFLPPAATNHCSWFVFVDFVVVIIICCCCYCDDSHFVVVLAMIPILLLLLWRFPFRCCSCDDSHFVRNAFFS